ncbi:MAG: hypothetical protein GY810_20335 [Aureispira sp.]|nr:hypothetical protein [Aureispira sp.]
MKITILTLSLLLSSSILWAQLTEADTFAFLNLKLYQPDGSAYANQKVLLKGKKPGHQVTVKTNAKGLVKAKVPMSDTYSIHCGKDQCFRTVDVGDFPYVTKNFQGYTRRFLYFKFVCTQLNGAPLVGEEVSVTSNTTGEVYTDSSNAKGIAEFYLPYEYDFSVSLDYYPEITSLNPKENKKEYKMMSSGFSWIGSKEKERLAIIADSLAKVREKEIIAEAKARKERLMLMYDSLALLNDRKDIIDMDVTIPITDDTEWVGKCIRKKTKAYEEQLKKDPKFFEKMRKPILAPLYRFRDKWKNAVIVTDMTGSMSPYREQVLVWHALTMTKGHNNKYVFFTDENDKGVCRSPNIGKAGGLYTFQGKMSNFESLIKVMRKSIEKTWPNSSTPENDLEAALTGQRIQSKADELVLIVDNFSPVRDIALLEQLKVPVHIIICGTSACSRWKIVNEQYLNIAYKTGGSVHSIEKDLFDLGKQQEGATLHFAGAEYVVYNGQIVLKKKI